MQRSAGRHQHEVLARRRARSDPSEDAICGPELAAYLDTMTARATAIRESLDDGALDLIIDSLRAILPVFLPGAPIPVEISRPLWDALTTALPLSFKSDRLFDLLCFVMARLLFHAPGIVDESQESSLFYLGREVLKFIISNPDRQNYYQVNFLANLLDDLIHKSYDWAPLDILHLLQSRPMSAADFLFLKHYVLHFGPAGVEAQAHFVEFIREFVHWFLELVDGEPENLRIAIATVAGLCHHTQPNCRAVAEDCRVIYRLLELPNHDIVTGCLVVVYELVDQVPELSLDEFPLDHVKSLVADDADPDISPVAWEAIQVLRVLCERRGSFALAADVPAFMVALVGTGCPYRLRVHAVSAVAEFLYYTDPWATQGVVGDQFLEVIGTLLGFVIENAEGDTGLASKAVWTVQGLRYRLLGLGLDRECAAMFAAYEIEAFFERCAEFDDSEIQDQIHAFWTLDAPGVDPKGFREMVDALDRRIEEAESAVRSERDAIEALAEPLGDQRTPVNITFTYRPKSE
jgi:hypothetical protein